MQDVLLTGAFGTVGTAVIDHLADDERYEFAYLDREPHDSYDGVVADVTDYEAIRPAFDGRDAVVHLAGCPRTDGSWGEVLTNNVVGTYNALEAARDAGVESFVFASSNHVVGMYEAENVPAVYEAGFDLTVDHRSPRRPDSYYGASKSFGEDLGRYYVEDRDAPRRFYALRICSVRDPEYDHPFGDAERGVREGRWEQGSDAYAEAVARMRAMWQSRRDCAQLVDRCLRDDDATFGVFYGVSDNERRWFDIDHAREEVGYDPRDAAEEWDAPPESAGSTD